MMPFHYASLLSLNMIRAFQGKEMLEDINTTPKDRENLKMVSGYCTLDGHHSAVIYKDKIYTIDVRAFDPKQVKVGMALMADDVIKNGGF